MSETTIPSSLPVAAAVQAIPEFAGGFLPADVVATEAFASLAYSTPHFETDLEIAPRHLDVGDASPEIAA